MNMSTVNLDINSIFNVILWLGFTFSTGMMFYYFGKMRAYTELLQRLDELKKEMLQK